MDGGSYNNIVRTSSPFSQPPSATTPTAYKANVNRTKTRKWVEARQNNYDGDDWGNDYDDDEDLEEPKPLPLKKAPTGGLPSTLRAVSQPLQGRHIDSTDAYGRRSFGEPSTGQNASVHMNESFIPQDHIQPVYSMEGPSDAQPSFVSNTQALPVYAQEPQSSGPASTAFPPRKSSIVGAGNVSQGNLTPQVNIQPDYSAGGQTPDASAIHTNAPVQAGSPPPTENKRKFVRPSDIYKRMSLEQDKEHVLVDSNQPSLEGIAGRGSDTASPELYRASDEQRRKASFDREEHAEPASFGDRPSLATVAEKEQSANTSPIKSSANSVGEELRLNGPKSTSPQLPEVSRMSMFGDDFFSSNMKDASTRKATAFAPITESQERQVLVNEANASQVGATEFSTAPTDAGSTKKTPHGHLTRPSLPGGWVSETTNVDSTMATPLETPEESVIGTDRAQDEPTAATDYAHASNQRKDPPTATAPSVQYSNTGAERKFGITSSSHPQELGHHPTPQSLPPLQTPNSLKSTSGPTQEKPSPNTVAPASSVYQDFPITMSHLQSSAAESPSGPYSAAAPISSRSEGAPPIFPPSLAGPRKSTLSSVATASPLKESDKLSDEILRSLSPAVDASTGARRLGATTSTTTNALDQRHDDRSLSGIYDDYYGFQEDKTLQETGRALKTDVQTPEEHAGAEQPTARSAVPHHNSNMPEIRPLSPKKTAEAQPSTENRDRRFSFDAGPERVLLSPVEAPTSTAVSFGSSSDRQQAKPDYTDASRPEAVASAPLREVAVSPEPALPQLQPATSTITHQVSQLSIGADNDADTGSIVQPSPVSAERSAVPIEDGLMPVEDKVLVQPGFSAGEPSMASKLVSESVLPAGEAEAVPEAADTAHDSASNIGARIMPFREILSIGLPQHRIQKFDDTRLQFFHMDTGLSEWLHYMHGQEGGTNADQVQAGNDAPSAAAAVAPQQPYYQQYLNASNPNLVIPPPSRSGTSNIVGQAPSTSQGQGQPGASGFNTGGQVGTKGKELLQAAGVLGNKGVKTGMKFFSKSKTKLREKVNQ
ncbi:hypothetical protein MN608_10336 [Microdochium nivale]|nr:hypothetical protein MN608_10336 [Microdochium nivale]